jgi:hypothetical protein
MKENHFNLMTSLGALFVGFLGICKIAHFGLSILIYFAYTHSITKAFNAFTKNEQIFPFESLLIGALAISFSYFVLTNQLNFSRLLYFPVLIGVISGIYHIHTALQVPGIEVFWIWLMFGQLILNLASVLIIGKKLFFQKASPEN